MRLMKELLQLEGRQSEPARMRRNKRRRDARRDRKIDRQEGFQGDLFDQQRGPRPGAGGKVSRQPLGNPTSNRGGMRSQVAGTPPPGTMPMSGEKFESDKQGQAAYDWLMGRRKNKGQLKFKFESRLISALTEDQFSPELTPSQKRSGHRLGPQVNPKRKRGVKQGIPIPKDTVIPEPQQKPKDAPTGMRTPKTRKQTQSPTDRPQDQEFLGDAPRDIDTRTPWEKTLTNKALVARAIRKAGGPKGVAKRRATAREDKRERDREQKEWEAANESFESRLIEALYSDADFLMEKMSRMKKALVGGGMAVALAAGAYHKGKSDAGPKEPQRTHLQSMGRGRVTTDKDLDIVRPKFDPSKKGPTGQGKDPRQGRGGAGSTD